MKVFIFFAREIFQQSIVLNMHPCHAVKDCSDRQDTAPKSEICPLLL